jgi:long-chain acyl-CoA synthetase
MQTLSEFIPRFRSLGRREAIRHSTIYSSRIVTWNELYNLIGTCISFLQEHNVQPGDRVMIQAENCPEWVALFWACVARGVHVVPIDFNFSADLAARIRTDCRASLSVDSAGLEELRIRASHGSTRDFTITPATPDGIVEIIYTSGTTGEPHGIVHRHRNICANLDPFQKEISKYRRWATPFQPIRILELLPLSHMFGQSMGLFVPFMLEGSVAFTSEIRPSAIVSIIRDNRISVLVSVPRNLESLRLEMRRYVPSMKDQSKSIFSGLPGVAERWWKFRKVHSRFGWKFWAFVAGGARVDPDLEEFWGRLGFAVIQGYGLTEASPVVAVNHPFSSRRGSLGKPVPGQEVRIAEDGEILVRGESIAGTVDAEGWLHTGDLGEIDSEGRLYFRGRKKDVIVTPDGLNVSPDDVEEVLRKMPEIKDSAIVSIGDQVHAALIMRNADISRDEIAQLVRRANERLEAHQRIRNWSIWPLGDFPRTASTQKIKRGLVAEQLRKGDMKEIAEPDPSSMSSLERVELLTRLEERHGIEIDEQEFSRATTPADLKQFMSHPTEAQSSPPLPSWPLSLPIRALRSVFQRCIAIPVFRHWLPLTITGIENLKGIEPPVLFAANHASDLDTPAVFTALPAKWRKRIAPAVRADYFGSSLKFRIQFIAARTLYNAFPLPQEISGTRRAFDYTAELVRRGFCPLVFPEGRRTRDGKLQSFRPGIAMMAVRLRIPVVPIYIAGMYEVYSREDSWPKTGPVTVSIGKPIRFSASTPIDDATQTIRDAMVKLADGAELKKTI